MTLKLDATSSIEAAKFIERCDGMVEGFRLAMEVNKAMMLKRMAAQTVPVSTDDSVPQEIK